MDSTRPSPPNSPLLTYPLHVQSKEYIIKIEACIRPDLPKNIAENIKFEDDILFNSFYLSFENGAIHFNLM
jgi:hypothetical protein